MSRPTTWTSTSTTATSSPAHTCAPTPSICGAGTAGRRRASDGRARTRGRARHLDRAGRRGTGRPAYRRRRRHRRVVAVPARRARRPLPPDRLRQPRGWPHGDARRPRLGGGDGGRRGRCPPRARHSPRPRRRFLRRQHRRSRAGAPPPRARAQPRAPEHLAGDGPYLRSWLLFVRWLVEVAPSEHAFLDHDTSDRLPEIAAPTLVLAGGRDSTSRPELCRAVAELIPGALFEVMEEEAHQPFQEVPDEWNARVDAFWREVEARG